MRRTWRKRPPVTFANVLVMVIVAGLVGLALLLPIAAELGKRATPAGAATAAPDDPASG